MSNRHKIVFQTNAPWLKSGLAENGRTLMNWLARRDKYDLTYYCSQTFSNDGNLDKLPYKAYGAIPADQNFLNQFANDPGKLRDIYYGGSNIEKIIKEVKPTIWVGSDDIWAFPNHYFDSEWFKKINSVMHITVDSFPISDMAYKQAQATKYYLTWAKFAVAEMAKRDPKCSHVDFIYGASDTKKFKPISSAEKRELRKQLGIDPKDKIFIYLGRNQLRKEFGNVLQAFSIYKKNYPKTPVKLLFHTAWSESSNGWDIPKLRDYFGINKEDVLATTICRSCGKWEIKPYEGENTDCGSCGSKKSVVTVNGWNEGVSDEELHLIYGIADASISAFTSGGLEFHNVNSLLCGLPLACTNYSCGEDFCEQPFVFPIKWHSRHEHQSSFIKAANDVYSIVEFITKIVNSSNKDLEEVSEKGLDWARKTFSIDTIGQKWEKLFDSMPLPDWSSIDLNPVRKNENYPMPNIDNSEEWVRALYKNILMVDPDPDGFKHWIEKIQQGTSKQDIYNFFIKRAQEDNRKNEPAKDFSSLFDNNGRKRIFFAMKESGGDLFVATSLFKGLKDIYPDSDLYVGCDPKFAEVVAGNPYVYKIIAYHPIMEQELAMRQFVDYYYYPAIATQVRLNYLTHDNVGLKLNHTT